LCERLGRTIYNPIKINMNKLAKLMGINDAEAGRPMNDACFETEQEKDFYRSSYECRVGELALNELGLNWAAL
jgi:hypothetical protein